MLNTDFDHLDDYFGLLFVYLLLTVHFSPDANVNTTFQRLRKSVSMFRQHE